MRKSRKKSGREGAFQIESEISFQGAPHVAVIETQGGETKNSCKDACQRIWIASSYQPGAFGRLSMAGVTQLK